MCNRVINFSQNQFWMVVTTRNEVGAGLCFYTCLWFCSQGGSAPLHAGIHSLDQRQARADTPPPRGQAPSPPAQCTLGDTGNKRAVRILLECNLVGFFYIYRYTLTVKVTKLFTACGMLHFPRPLKSIKRKSISKIFSVFHINAKKNHPSTKLLWTKPC